MNVCHVITRLIIGGAQENTLLTCRGLAERGCTVTLIAGPETGPEGSLWLQAQRADYEAIKLPPLRRAVNPLEDLCAMWALTDIFKRIQPDVVHTHSSKAGILGRAAAARACVPTVLHTIHGMSFNRTQSAPVRWLYRRMERWAARRTTAFITVADAMADQAAAAGIASREQFTTIRSGIETERFKPCSEAKTRMRQRWDVGDNDIVVGTIARLFDNKGYDEIIAAMPSAIARRPELRFVWVGDGPRRDTYKTRLQKLGLLDRVTFAGLIDPCEVAAHVNGFDIALHASRWEGLPRALVQALLVEVPAVSFDNDGAPEVVVPNETGLLVPFGNTQALGDAVVELASDADLRKRLGRAGRRLALQSFTCENMVDNILALYQGLRSEGDKRHGIA